MRHYRNSSWMISVHSLSACIFGIMTITLLFSLGLSQGQVQAAGNNNGGQESPYHLFSTVTVPGTPASVWCYDGATVSQNGTVYLSDADRKGLDVIKDGSHPAYQGIIGQGTFTGPGGCKNYNYDLQGPDGVVLADNMLFAGNGDSSVRVYSTSGKFISSISTGGLARADEETYDAHDNEVIVANSGERDLSPQAAPFLSFISISNDKDKDTPTFKVVKKLIFPQATSLEQPMWNPNDGKLYLSVPGTTNNPGGEVDIINPGLLPNGVTTITDYKKQHIDVIPTPDCGDAGLAIGSQDKIAVGCGNGTQIIIDLHTYVLTRIPVVGVDIVASTDKYFFFPSYGSATQAPELAITDMQGHIVQTFPITADSHTVAVDPTNGHVIVPLDGGAVAIYALVCNNDRH
jgi:hypothetical protein